MPPHVDFVISMLCVSTLISGPLLFQTCSFILRHKFTVNIMVGDMSLHEPHDFLFIFNYLFFRSIL